MRSRSGNNLAGLLICIFMIALGYFGGELLSKYQSGRKALPDRIVSLREIGEITISPSFMDRLLIVEDTTQQYNRIKLILSVPVSTTYTTDLAGLEYEVSDEGEIVFTLPEIRRGETSYDLDHAVSLDLTNGFGQKASWGRFEDMYSLFSEAVAEDRKALDNELDRAGYPDEVRDALQNIIRSIASGWDVTIRFGG